MKPFLSMAAMVLAFITGHFSSSAQRNGPVLDYQVRAVEPGANFFDIVRDNRKALADYRQSLPEAEREGESFREAEARFERWVHHVKGRVSRNGSMAYPLTGWYSWMEANPEGMLQPEKKSRSTTVWTNFTPYTGYQPNDTTHANGWTYGYGIGRVNVVRQHPTNKSKLYAGTSNGGVFVSNNYGQSWAATTDQFAGLGVSDLVLNPGNPNEVLLATGDFDNPSYANSIGIFKSTNGGTTWTQVYVFTLTQAKHIAHILFDPADNSIVLATTTDQVLKSTDGGNSWSPVRTTAGAGFNDIVVTTAGHYYVSSKTGGLIRSTNGGSTWTVITTGVANRIDMDYHAATNMLYLLGEDNPAFRKYNATTLAFTAAWSNISTTAAAADPDLFAFNSQQGYNQVITVNPANANDVIVGEFNGKRSTNGGTTWTDFLNGYYDPGDPNASWGGTYVHSDHHHISFIPGTDSLLIGNDGGVYLGKIGTNTWNMRFNGLVATQSYSMAISQNAPEAFMFGNQDNDGYSRANLGGYKWFMAQAGDGTATAINPSNENQRLLSGTKGSLSRNTNGYTTSYTGTGIKPLPADEASWVMPLEAHPNGNFFYGGYDEVKKYNFSTNTWSVLGDPGGNTAKVDLIVLANLTATTSRMYVMNDESDNTALYRSANESTFSPVSSPSATEFNQGLTCSKANWDSVFVCVRGYNAAEKVFRSTNGGASWTNITYNLPNILMKSIALKQGSDTLFLGTELGLYFLKLSGPNTWAKYGAGLPNTTVTDIEINYAANKLYVSTMGRGGWFIELGNAVLPLQDLAFTATPGVGEGQYDLQWSWKDEGLTKVSLERSRDGQQYETVEVIEGNPSAPVTYPVSLLAQKEFYRLRGVFEDGEVALSQTLALSRNGMNGGLTVFPNPSNGRYSFVATEPIQLVQVSDLSGQIIIMAQPGSATYSVGLEFLPAGVYLAEVRTQSGASFTEKLVLNK